ncbi:MAG: hypothetical protein AB7S26_17275 [Sandaracinaceae bacterium]
MGDLSAYIPWALFGIMVFFGLVFAIVAWSATRRAGAAEDAAESARAQEAQALARAEAAERRLHELEHRASSAEARIAGEQERAQRADARARELEARAAEESRRAESALEEAKRADAELRERRDAVADRDKRADARARSLLDWARQEWEKRRESDRQRAQAVQGSFQAQLDAYLEHRRAPITFRADSEVDQLAAPRIVAHARAGEQVSHEGELVRVRFPVDPSQGFRA